MTELKPCPFCGGKLFTTYFERGSIDMRGLCCENDDCAINDHIAKEYSKERLDIAINTRSIEDTLQARIAEIIRIAGETLAEFIDCPHDVYDWNHPIHDCEKCDSCNADSCFCWEIWLKELLIKERGGRNELVESLLKAQEEI